MKVKPNPDFASIRHIGTKWEDFISIQSHKDAFDIVMKSNIFKTPSKIDDIELLDKIDPNRPNVRFFNETTRLGIMEREYPSSEGHPYTFECPPTDSNPRTGGVDAPLRVNLKSGPNGQSLGSQAKDLCALKCTHPQLLEPLTRMWGNWC